MAASVISRRVAKVHKRLKRVDGVLRFTVGANSIGVLKGFYAQQIFFSGDKEMQGGGVRV